MNDPDFEDAVLECVTTLAEAFGRAVSKPTVRAYEYGLAGLSVDQITVATAAALRTCKFMPPPAELREMAGIVRLTDRAERAWIAFDAALSEHSVYKTLLFDDVVINSVVRSLGGISVALETPAEEYQRFYRGKFLKAYEALARSRVGAEQCGPLLGEFDRVNGKNDAPPLVIAVGLPPLPGMPQVEDWRLIASGSRAASVPRVEFKRA